MEKDIDPQLAMVIEAAVERLPDRQRMIFLAVRDEEARYSTLAERLGISTEEVERTFAAALIALANAADG